MSALAEPEYPPAADLRLLSNPLPMVQSGTVHPDFMDKNATLKCVSSVLTLLNDALSSHDVEVLSSCFFEQAYWRDIVALTSHLRTIGSPRPIAIALMQMTQLRKLDGEIVLVGDPQFVTLGTALMFIDCGITFHIRSPALRCAGKLLLLPVKDRGIIDWKIWVLSTWIEDLLDFPENVDRLSSPNKALDRHAIVKVDVLIVGAGTSGLMTAARLKTFGFESVVLERNMNIGDNWTNRYDSLNFHVPTSNCELPYMRYREKLQSPHRLSKHDVAEHLKKYAGSFGLNVITGARIHTTVYNVTEKLWTFQVAIEGQDGYTTVVCKHLVQATGLGSGKPNLPLIEDAHLYGGLQMHSAQYRNADSLKEIGAKTAVIVGSANTAFDVMQDCWEANLKTTMVVRSPTYIFPYDYVIDSHGIGAYDTMSLDAADRLMNTLPSMLDGQFSHELFAYLASREPDRYAGLKNAGFPVIDSRDPSANVLHHLLERGGGHYVDIGGTDLIAEGKVGVRGLVEPVAYTESGLRLSDNTLIDADVIIWCTGFADKNIKETAQEVLGTKGATSGSEEELGPKEIVSRLDTTWGVDAEGEVRGVGKRHLNMDNFWVIGGTIQHQRWWSRGIVQQIKLALEGELPPAYRDTPLV